MSAETPSLQPAKRDPALDGLRGVAVLLVYLFHYGGGLRAHNPVARAFGYLTQAGWTGVELFFVLSGFLITGLLLPLSETPSTIRNFYARRALRILPLLYVTLLVSAVAALFWGARFEQLRPFLVYAAFLQNVPPFVASSLRTPAPLPVFHLWSLSVEEQFYLVWPLLLALARTPRRALWLCIGTFVLSCLFRLIIVLPGVPFGVAAVLLPSRAGALALGGALAVLRYLQPSRVQREKPVVLLALAGMAVYLSVSVFTRSCLLNSRPAFLLGLPAVDLIAFAMIALSLQTNPFRAALSTPALGFLGRISYGIYIFHILLQPVFDQLGKLLTHASSGFAYQTVRLVLALPLSVLVSWFSWMVLERPFLRQKGRFPLSSPSVGALPTLQDGSLQA